jgi:hypothetical protein
MTISTRACMIYSLTILGLMGLGLSQTDVRVEGETTTSPDVPVQNRAVDTVGDIEPSDVNKLQRRKNAKQFTMVGFGPAGFMGVQDENRLSYDFYIGRVWEAASRAAIKSTLELTSDFEDNHMADLNLGANFYLVPTDFSPYIGGAFGLGAMRGNSEQAFGFSARGSIGALLFRTSNAQLNIEGGAKMLFSDLGDDFPAVYMATIGLLF